MAEEAQPIATETPPEVVTTDAAAQVPANDTGKPAGGKPANDNATPEITEAQVIELAEKYGPEKALQIIARKLNYAVDGSTVSVAERKAFRDEQRKAKAALEDWKKNIADEWDGKINESKGEIEFGRALKAAKETGDYDGIARGLGFKDWNELADDHIAKLADPNHKRLTELERKLQEKERAEAERAEQWKQQQAQQQQAAQIQGYKANMSGEMKASQNPILKELADFPDVVNMLFAVRQDTFRKTGAELPLEHALKNTLPGGTQSVEHILKSWHDALGKAFGAGTSAPAAAAPAAKGKAVGKTGPTPTPAPSATRNAADAKEWTSFGAKALEEAFKNEAQAQAEERRKGVNGAP